MKIANTRTEALQWRQETIKSGNRVGFVPTMGALHDGHTSLVELGHEHADTMAASIFVNPTQFAPGEDFDSYPRTREADLEKLEKAGCKFVYCPRVEDLYPEGDCTRVLVKGLSHILEGEFRPHFFEGVATVVSRLFVHLTPDVAIFGEKDYQQLQIIRRMTQDLGFQTKIIGGPTKREINGLAMSSRNTYLSDEERAQAAIIHQTMNTVADELNAGADLTETTTKATQTILDAGFDKVDYVEARQAKDLEPFADATATPNTEGRILVAAWMGKTRLIDNMGFTRT